MAKKKSKKNKSRTWVLETNDPMEISFPVFKKINLKCSYLKLTNGTSYQFESDVEIDESLLNSMIDMIDISISNHLSTSIIETKLSTLFSSTNKELRRLDFLFINNHYLVKIYCH